MTDTYGGVHAALVTPMTPEEAVDYPALYRLVHDLIDQGVQGLVPLGSTGEYYALDDEEREAVVTTTVAAAAGRVPVWVGANAGSTRDVIRYCRQAQGLGAAGVMLAAPYYSLPSPDELWEHFRAVSQAVDISIMLYNYPGRTGVDMTPELVERLAELDNIRYVKESSGDVTRVSEIIRRCGGRMTVFCGCDSLALESFLLGAAGWVGGVVNVLPREHVELFELAAKRGDWPAARQLYYRILPALALMESGKYTQRVKAGCQLMGRPVGPPRRPLRPLSDEEFEALAVVLRPFQP
ncbi:MAG TPA: 4-hydroxy-tetrahydrodipicolinate synthase [Planctomycetaceae bacterium]|nr:4-hydroxy-tetrahydrodipicolinate synthase [Planctomycetaceae bacterium]